MKIMTSFSVYLNKLQGKMNGIRFAKYYKDETVSSKVVAADCVAATPEIKKRVIQLLNEEINENGVPLEIEDFPNTNLFKLKLK